MFFEKLYESESSRIDQPEMLRIIHPEVFFKKGVFKNFAKFTRKQLCQGLFLNKVASLRPPTFLKKRLWHRVFSVNFTNFLRIPFFIEHISGGCFWMLRTI